MAKTTDQTAPATEIKADAFSLEDSDSEGEEASKPTIAKSVATVVEPTSEVVEILLDEDTVEDAVKEAATEKKDVATEPEASTSAETNADTVTPGIEATTDTANAADDAPPLPQRRLSTTDQSKQTLQEAFPNVEEKYITAVLIASQGILDPAFNALLYLSDPSFIAEIPSPHTEPAGFTPALPSRPAQVSIPGLSSSQLEEDEALARRLAREFEQQDRTRRRSHQRPDGPPPRSERPPPSQRPLPPRPQGTDDEDTFDKFFDEDLPQFQKSFVKGVEETRTKLNSWVTGIASKFSQEEESSPGLFGALGGNVNASRNDTDFENTEAERLRQQRQFQRQKERELSRQNYGAGIALNDYSDDPPVVPSKTRNSNGKSVSFSGESTTIEPGARAEKEVKADREKDSKWELLATVVPEPARDDAFIVTDSDEEDVPTTSESKK
ncbi:hypothetical protein BABINDRAFT_160546 [Babjeviella inositovora NRRL Y-12698]|uniref:CUE domain-containing protein n=1 Tax=Babjeviella inositovora NRRL Y-12698 TaxID=984486 RepID=A0A1E3QTX5_9ASCO|nr:uncharacterized protein BABINDRAFT_160546 [Babjeviella inositovora NRRL Y-12698]ODQ81146.1 hypothetical protein BABINDRAFT_160546 [Babjeviella inositovora NRRL Y-12698]